MRKYNSALGKKDKTQIEEGNVKDICEAHTKDES